MEKRKYLFIIATFFLLAVSITIQSTPSSETEAEEVQEKIIIKKNIIYSKSDPELWFKSQIDTGSGNCGPACAAMIIQRDGTDITVEAARDIIGYKIEDGATSISELTYILQQYHIGYYET